jgi:DNA-binding NtrC family response regulator
LEQVKPTDEPAHIVEAFMSRTILIVDDDPVQLRMLEAALMKLGYPTVAADSGEAALKRLDAFAEGEPAAILLDLVMPGMGGLEVLETLRQRDIAVPVIVQTAQGSIEVAVSAMRAGAFDFVVKPASMERLRTALDSALKVGSVETAARRRNRGGRQRTTFKDLVGRSTAMEHAVDLARRAARTDIPVLIEGESGVGKELVAKAIQAESARRNRPFVTVNCGAIPDTLVESILFGHEKGSFTGATEKHVGKFVEANGGTLFLDEIGELPPSAQVKLLRAVQDGEVDPVGGRATVKVDIRLISATHRDLLQLVKDGQFREDLYYRLNVFPIQVPALRMRRDDIPALVTHFLERLGSQAGRTIEAISDGAMELLMAHDWPGNIRQLENAVLRAIVLAESGTLTEEEFPQIRAQVEGIDINRHLADIAGPDEAEMVRSFAAALGDLPEGSRLSEAPLREDVLELLDAAGEVRRLAEIEKEVIRFAIRYYNGQMSAVARRLGIGRSTLYRKLKEYDIDPYDIEGRDERRRVS